jgi:hypothetical protein
MPEEESGEQLLAQEKTGAAGVLGFADFCSVESKLDTFTHSSEEESSNSFDNYYEETEFSYETGSVSAEMFSAGFINYTGAFSYFSYFISAYSIFFSSFTY